MTQGTSKPIPNYSPPKGPAPTGEPGSLGGTNHGNAGTQQPSSPQTPIGPGQKGPYGR